MRMASKIILSIVALVVIALLAIIFLVSVLYPPKTDESLEKTMEIAPPSLLISTEDVAIGVVRQRTEVFKYEFELSKAGKKASFRAEDRGEVWAVQVFEVVTNGDSSHTATFNWYIVNKSTGGIEPEFSFVDS